jgi:hypothetical protein
VCWDRTEWQRDGEDWLICVFGAVWVVVEPRAHPGMSLARSPRRRAMQSGRKRGKGRRYRNDLLIACGKGLGITYNNGPRMAS